MVSLSEGFKQYQQCEQWKQSISSVSNISSVNSVSSVSSVSSVNSVSSVGSLTRCYLQYGFFLGKHSFGRASPFPFQVPQHVNSTYCPGVTKLQTVRATHRTQHKHQPTQGKITIMQMTNSIVAKKKIFVTCFKISYF